MRTCPGLINAVLTLAAVLLFIQSADASRPPWMRKKIEPVYPEILVSAGWLAENLGRADLAVVDARSGELVRSIARRFKISVKISKSVWAGSSGAKSGGEYLDQLMVS